MRREKGIVIKDSRCKRTAETLRAYKGNNGIKRKANGKGRDASRRVELEREGELLAVESDPSVERQTIDSSDGLRAFHQPYF